MPAPASGKTPGKSTAAPAPVPLRESLRMAWSLKPIFLPAMPAAIGVLLLALVQADLLVGATFLGQHLLDSFITGGAPASAGVGPWLTSWLTRLFGNQGSGMIALGLILTALLAEALSLLASQWRFRISQGFRSRLQQLLLDSMFRAAGPQREKLDTATAQMMFNSDSGGLGMFLIFGFLGFVEQIVKLTTLTFALCRFSDGRGWMLAVVLVPAAFAFKAIVSKLFLRWEQRTAHQSDMAMMQTQRAALDFFPLMARLVYLGGERTKASHLLEQAEVSARGNQKLQWVTNLHGSTAQILAILALPVAALLMLQMEVSPGVVVQGQGLFAGIIATVGIIVSFPSQIIQYAPALRRVSETLAIAPLAETPEAGNSSHSLKSGIHVRKLRFSYDPGNQPDTLHDLDFQIPAGSLVCIVGGSGSGKSTLARLLIGERLPQEGSIVIDDIDVTPWHLLWRRNRIAFLTAEVGFFRDSVVANIQFGRPEVSAEKAREIASSLGLGAALEKYADAPLHSPDTQLSTGEQRRVGVARLLAGSQPVWILDEPLSNLDPTNMRQVAEAIESAARTGRTILVITHDPEFIRSDFNLFLKDGRIAARGTHAELMATCEEYRERYHREAANL
ncbi:MAG: ABC transporter ATP-binding protein/permease [Akkermansiaceae bacterium]|jgi:ABC-type multidrug transport system fused ATPase/permease subunit|nr:ABC transporter ATP-binding protein/permease [Akkermansiaceae bacterium]